MTQVKLQKAIKLATKLHKWQKRKSWEDYIEHPLAVMEILKRYDFTEDVLISAVLHDICEDTEATNIYIREEFWDRIWFIVNALTKNKKPVNNKELKERFEREKSKWGGDKTFKEFIDYRFLMYVNRFYVWIIADPWIMFIKIADQIHNLSTMQIFPKEKIKRKIAELEDHFLPVYKKSEELITPMYMPKYEWMLKELREKIEEAKKY